MTREPLQEFLAASEQAVQDGTFVRLALDNPFGPEAELNRVYVRKILVKKQEMLSFTYRYTTRDTVKNHSLAEAAALLGELLTHSFRAARLCTTAFDLRLELFAGRKPLLKKTKPSRTEPAPLAHDRQKQRLVAAEGKPWLHALGVTDAAGNVLKTAQDKYRQINKYVEILSGLIAQLPPEKRSPVVDMGCGKGYLTFALYDYMAQSFALKPQVTGVDARADMVELCNGVARLSGFDGLRFVQGTIAEQDCAGVHILVALHACDTATDEAIAQGVKAGAELIVVAPCCHKQIRKQMHLENDLGFLLRHGIFAERQAEMVTDGLRAMILDYFGYHTKVFEFISDAHTPKNVMIAAVKTGAGLRPEMLGKIQAAKAYFGIGHHALEGMVGGIPPDPQPRK